MAVRWRNAPLPEPHLLTLAVGAILERHRPWRLRMPERGRRLAGWSLVAVGTTVIMASWTAAQRTRLACPDRLLVGGPYAYSRNPMYVGWALLHLGVGVIAGSGWVLVGLPPAAAAIHLQVLREEQELQARFGAAFDRYRRRVPRYVPRSRWDQATGDTARRGR